MEDGRTGRGSASGPTASSRGTSARSRRRRRGQAVASSRILITGITAQGRHGANAGERIQPQAFTVDLDVLLEVGGDSLQDTLDYKMLADLVRDTVSQKSFVLLESLAQ